MSSEAFNPWYPGSMVDRSTRAITIPVLFAVAGDPVGSGLVTSLARPGGNVTGLSNLALELVFKCLEVLSQAVPVTRCVALLWQPGNFPAATEKELLRRPEVAWRALGMRPQFVEARGPADLDTAFSNMTKGSWLGRTE